jgi:hypothetical protein
MSSFIVSMPLASLIDSPPESNAMSLPESAMGVAFPAPVYVSFDVARLGDFHHREFATIAKPGFRQFRQYLKINAASRISPFRRLSCLAEMTRHYLQSAFDRNAGTALAEDDVDAPLLLRMLLADDVEMPGAARAPRRRHPAA